ncbi:RNA polymerase-associated protein RapA [Litoribrevibacter albus]|uniref:RNA polymerase-associated protein RapA n=1 Tax=Litoribrevibacter albus TaxID=1473156 RepID=A0AA37S9P1_9GAMM|nr:RNA polymerase-associated protein RapA [Litoribrevibacter albus]GLQ31815.1 RNA polymerase-associated protein RapA [Litoribrevibacter albus]
MSFSVGQRYLSTTELELGLGIITQVDHRMVEIFFPAAEERRTYASNNAPLSRIAYKIGDTVTDREGNEFKVLEFTENNGVYIYFVEDSSGETRPMPELEVGDQVALNAPWERLAAGNIDGGQWFHLRYKSLIERERLEQAPYYGLMGPRISLTPHQFFIANNVAQRPAPRVLLADEVGLGKTIEAGLIIHQQLMNGRASRVLISVPDTLVHQWLVEMLRKFNLHFSVYDKQRAMEPNAFEQNQLILISNKLWNEEEILNSALAADWDLLVVDEAHHLHWSEQEASPEYQHVQQLSEKAAGLLLLTATPEQLGLEGHFARLHLLDPQRFNDLNQFIDQEESYFTVSSAINELIDASNVSEESLDKIQAMSDDSVLSDLVQSLRNDQTSANRNKLINHLIDHHGTGRVLFRNTRAAIKGFPQRVLVEKALERPELYSAFKLTPETDHEPSQWLAADPRVNYLVELYKELKEKLLVICHDAETALALEEHLRLREGYRTTAFHEGMSIIEQDRSAAYFADMEDGAQLLICSEIGSEGRNFQFAHHIVMFDLPSHPDLLEQRIGRLDRIGQTEDIKIHVPYFTSSVQDIYKRWYDEGLNAFSKSCATGDALIQKYQEEINQCVMSMDDAAIAALINKTAADNEELTAKIENGRDRLLELNSCQPERALNIVHTIEDFEFDDPKKFMDMAYNCFGVDRERHSENTWVVQAGEQMLTDHFPGVGDEPITVTYDRERALEREDFHFLTWEHPMVTGVMDLVLDHHYGNASFTLIKDPRIPAGTLYVETLHTPVVQATKASQCYRFMPNSVIRHVVSHDNKDFTQYLTDQHIHEHRQKISKALRHEVIKSQKELIYKVFQVAESQAKKKLSGIIDEAKQNATEALDLEINRLTTLKSINPNVRQEEIDALIEQKEICLNAIQGGQIKLEAIRVIVNGS